MSERRPLAEYRIAAQAAWALVAARFQLRFRAVEPMKAWAARPGSGHVPRAELLIGFRRAARRIDGTCLERALALQRLLSRHGHRSELHIGVARTDEGFAAHAWLAAGDEILVGEGEEAASFTPLVAWPGAEKPGS